MLSYTRKCPECGSKNITLWMGGEPGVIHVCKDCGYRGPLVVEEDVEN